MGGPPQEGPRDQDDADVVLRLCLAVEGEADRLGEIKQLLADIADAERRREQAARATGGRKGGPGGW